MPGVADNELALLLQVEQRILWRQGSQPGEPKKSGG